MNAIIDDHLDVEQNVVRQEHSNRLTTGDNKREKGICVRSTPHRYFPLYSHQVANNRIQIALLES
jgi:hypothetical protein